jgi:hypothetical protein
MICQLYLLKRYSCEKMVNLAVNPPKNAVFRNIKFRSSLFKGLRRFGGRASKVLERFLIYEEITYWFDNGVG